MAYAAAQALLAVPGGRGENPPAGKRRRAEDAEGGGTAVISKMLTVLLRMGNEVRAIGNALVTVIIIHDGDMKKELDRMRRAWADADKDRPKRTKRGGGAVVDLQDDGAGAAMADDDTPWKNPLGNKQLLLFSTALTLAAQQVGAGHAAIPALSRFAQMDEATFAAQVSQFTPKHPTPKEGRAWVWRVYWMRMAIAVPGHADAVQLLHTVKADGLKIAQAHEQESDIEKDLWRAQKARGK